MKLARFSVQGWESYGLVEDDRVRVIQGDIFGEHRLTAASYPLSGVKLLPPSRPTCYWAIGLNYAAHVAHQEQALDAERIRQDSQSFRPWNKGANCIIGTGDDIILPRDSDYVHYEGELLIVIGKPARRVSVEEAPNFIMGYSVANDVSSEGSWHNDSSNWRKKCSDTFGPIGPWIETDVGDPHKLDIITRMNGAEQDRGSTDGMTYNCFEIVSGISEYITLRPGDIILTGAPGAVDQLNPGDVVDIEIPGIGVLSNPVTGED